MTMKEMAKKINDLKEQTLDQRRPEAVEKQKTLGKLTARKRLGLLFDNNTFLEYGQLACPPNYSPKEAAADGMVTGIGKIDGRRVGCIIYDFSVFGGSQSDLNHQKASHIQKHLIDQGYPCIYLLDGGGARVQDLNTFGYDFPDQFYDQSRMSGWIPMVGVMMGPCFAGHANMAGLCDFVIMVKGISQMGVAGTHLVKAALKLDITKEELGGAELHCRKTGMADYLADDEASAIAIAKNFLSYLPSNASMAAPEKPCNEDPERTSEKLLDIVPANLKQGYDMYKVIKEIVDNGEILDIKALYARNIITCLARFNGHSVGIVASQPLYLAGVLDTPASIKMAHFIEMCDAFNIPLIFLCDCPGFLGGPDAEKSGLIRFGMKCLYVIGHCTVPIIMMILRKSVGMGGYILGSRAMRPSCIFGWPTAEMTGMGLEGAVDTIYRKRIAESEEPEKTRAMLVEEFRSKMTAIPLAKKYGLDDVIDPRFSRRVMIQALERLSKRNSWMPPKKHGITPA